ncbi:MULTISPECIES: DMT family transporter [Bacillaceae]|uniref:DMT family transporter n=1 Tax=Evansella alkalicola TaxID=745819 RepID=A0ABS6JX90_9BACI|nr:MULTISPECIES: DMT family transporter [Bacillaceae]MBU9723010.1 DMT family transporter [Bacillus alkalicola]
MKGIIFALLGGSFITLQGVVNARISQDIGVFQAITITQLTGFILAFSIFAVVRDGHYSDLQKVKWPYLFGGAFGLLIIFNEVTAIQTIGVTLTISVLLIAQIVMAFIVDATGLFGLRKLKLHGWQFVGIGMMILGVIIIQL